MRARVVGTTVGAAGIAMGLVASSLSGVAVAGHTNSILTAKLTGKSEVGSKGDPNGRGSVKIFGVDGDDKTLCYVLQVKKIQLADEGMAAHIHRGAKDESGPVVVSLAGPGDGNAADCLTQGEKNAAGSKIFDGATVQEILNNPGDFYVNVHNPKLPKGAIRGQLRAVK